MREMLLMAMRGARDVVRRQEVNMNNLANVSTDGFRKEIAHIQRDANGHGVRNTTPDFSPGDIRTTGNSLDVAIAGRGWIAVAAPGGGETYSRRGDLRVDELGQLVNGAGQQLLGNRGPISIPPHGNIEIGSDGTVSVLPLGESANTLAVIDRIKLVNPGPAGLERGQDGLFRLANGAVAEEAADVRLVSGSLESSNVNAIESLVQMIDLSRAFESQVKMMKVAKEKQEHLAQVIKLR
ncbi:MAG: flagellar basal body rod protein FlgF [Halieaceae bacterium]